MINELWSRLTWWNAQQDRVFERIFDDWIGRRRDQAGGDCDIAATILWQVVRTLCTSGEFSKAAIRKDLGELLKDTKNYGGGLRHQVFAALCRQAVGSPHAERTAEQEWRLKQITKLMDVHWEAARAALLLNEGGNADKRDIEDALHKAAQSFVDTRLHVSPESDESIRLPPIDKSYPSGVSNPPPSELLGFYLGELSHSCRNMELPVEMKRAIFSGLAQLELALTWLLGLEQPIVASRRLIIPLVVSTLSPGRQQILDGSLAVLRMQQVSPRVTGLSNEGRVFPDPVAMGFGTFAPEWEKHFEYAKQWATQDASNQNGAVCFAYDLSFSFSEVAKLISFQGHRKLLRHSHCCGNSASLAAAMLIKSLVEEKQIAADHLVSGALCGPADNFQWQSIGGIIPKLVAFRDVLQQTFPQSTLILGKASSEDETALANLDDLTKLPPIKRPRDPQQAYDFLTGAAERLHRYATLESKRIWNSLSQFAPKRLHRELSRDWKDTNQKLNFSVLDEINMPQMALQYKPKETDSKRNEPNRKEAKPDCESLDSLLDDFVSGELAKETSQCLKLVGGPGMGKTWIGLRWHLKLIERAIQSQTDPQLVANSPTPLPIWTTVLQLQCVLDANPTFNVNQALIEILASRLGSENASVVELITEHLKTNQVLLILDGWDERNRENESEARLKNRLQLDWSSRSMIITSRVVGESTIDRDPLRWIAPRSLSWTIEVGSDDLSWLRFAKAWFGEDWEDNRADVERLAASPALSRITQVPQLATLACWLIQNGDLPEDHFHSGIILQAVIRSVLNKHMESNGSRMDATLRTLFAKNYVLDILQLMAYRTFKGNRWGFTERKLVDEFQKDEYRSLLCQANPLIVADEILRCGLFDRVASDQVQVIHQDLAEVLVASYLVKIHPQFNFTSTKEAIELALKFGLLDANWRNVWRCYSSLIPCANSLAQLLLTLAEDKCEVPLAMTIGAEAHTTILNCLPESSISGDIKLAVRDFADRLARELVTEIAIPGRYDTYEWYYGYFPRFLDDRRKICLQWAHFGYDDWLQSQLKSSEEIESEDQALLSKIAAMFLFQANRIGIEEFWEHYRLTQHHGGNLNDCSRQKRVDGLLHASIADIYDHLLSLCVQDYAREFDARNWGHICFLTRSATSIRNHCDQLVDITHRCLGAFPLSLEFCRQAISILNLVPIQEAAEPTRIQAIEFVQTVRREFAARLDRELSIQDERIPIIPVYGDDLHSFSEIHHSLVELESKLGIQVSDLVHPLARLSDHAEAEKKRLGRRRRFRNPSSSQDTKRELTAQETIESLRNCGQGIETTGYLRQTIARLLLKSYQRKLWEEHCCCWNNLWPSTDSERAAWSDRHPTPGERVYEDEYAFLESPKNRLQVICKLDKPCPLFDALTAAAWLTRNGVPWHWPDDKISEGESQFSDVSLTNLMKQSRALLFNTSGVATLAEGTLDDMQNRSGQLAFFDFTDLETDDELREIAEFTKEQPRIGDLSEKFWRSAYLP